MDERSSAKNPFLALVLSELALWQGDPLAARAVILSIDGDPGIPLGALRWALVCGMRAEAEIAANARSRHDEVGLADALARGTAFHAQMKAVSEEMAAGVRNSHLRAAAEQASCEAEFSRLEGRSDPGRWAAAAAAWDAMPVPYERGYALMREAEAVLAQRGDRSRAGRALNDAHAIATALGAVPLLRATEKLAVRARIALDRVGGGVGPQRAPGRAREQASDTPRRRLDLTPREREVLALLGAGRSNDEIGEILYVSGKTVSVHITNIKAKLGASSRVEIALYAIESGFAEGRAPASG